MRQLLVQVPRGQGKTVLEKAQAYDGANLSQFEATGSRGPEDNLIVHLSNLKIEDFLSDLESVPDLHVTLIPQGVMALQPPPSEAPEQVTDVEMLSPIEIFLAGLQSVGSWKGFLGYAAVAGIVVWIGLYTNTSYLLTAAMLIAPFAGPAMNVAIATARGDWTLLRRSLVRYFAAIGVTIAVTAFLSLVFQQQIATAQMVSTSDVSAIAVLLPLAAGAAGALNLAQSDRSSLVSGAATGMLVAASLAPPAGLVGMASMIGRWEMAGSGLFLLFLQLVGINLAGTAVFRLLGVTPRGARYKRGQRRIFPIALGITVALLGILLWGQFADTPSLQRSSQSQRAAAVIQQAVNQSGLANTVETNVRFTRASIPSQNSLLGVVYVQPRPDVALPPDVISDRLTEEIQSQLEQQDFDVTPLIDVTVLQPPAAS